jgi:hypothetical protein
MGLKNYKWPYNKFLEISIGKEASQKIFPFNTRGGNTMILKSTVSFSHTQISGWIYGGEGDWRV